MRRFLGLIVVCLCAACATQPETSIASAQAQAAKFQNAGNYAMAEKYHRQAVDELRRWPGRSDADLARQLANLASALNLNGKPTEAESLLLEAKAILEAQYPNDLTNAGLVTANLARSYELQGRLDEAEQTYLNAYALNEKLYGANHPMSAFELAGLADIYVQRGDIANGDKYHQAAMAIYARYFGEGGASEVNRRREYDLLREAAVAREVAN